MPRAIYKWNGKKMIKVWSENDKPKSAAIHQDTIDKIKSPITGEIFESKSQYLRHVKANGSDVVGNDLHSNRNKKPKDKITDSRILEAIYKAEATLQNPDKYKEYLGEQRELQERNERLLKYSRG